MEYIVYVYDKGFDDGFFEPDLHKITQVNYSFGRVVDGAVSIAHFTNFYHLAKLRRVAPHVRVNISIGGWGAGGFSEATMDANGREKLSQSAIDVLIGHGFDGIDWDWEYPTDDEAGIACSPNDDVNATDLLVLTREKLDTLSVQTGRKYTQSIAVGAQATRTLDYVWTRAVPALDTVNLMTYDLKLDGKTAHHANLMPAFYGQWSTARSVADFESAGVPREKMTIGAGWFFYCFEGVKPTDDNAYTRRGLSCAYATRGHATSSAQWYALLKQPHSPFTRYFDDEAQAAWYFDGETLLSGDDTESLKAKGRYALEQGLAGVIVWEYTCDEGHELLDALYDGMQNV